MPIYMVCFQSLSPSFIYACTVHIELSSEIDIPLTVNTVVTGPAGYVTNTSQPVTGDTPVHFMPKF